MFYSLCDVVRLTHNISQLVCKVWDETGQLSVSVCKNQAKWENLETCMSKPY